MSSPRYRIAIYTRTFPPRSGGISTAHANLYELFKDEHDVRLFAFDDDATVKDDRVARRRSPVWLARLFHYIARLYVRRYDKCGPIVYCPQIASVIPAIRSLNRAVRRFRPDIVILPDNYVPALAFNRPPGASVIWISHNNYRRFEGQPLVHQRSWMDLHLAHRLELRGLRKADHVICPSHYMKGVFEATLPANVPVSIIYNFVHDETLRNVQSLDLRGVLKLNPDQKLIYIPSAGTPAKGKRYTFEIIRRLGKAKRAGFYISGPIPDDLRRELNGLHDKVAVYFPGQLSYDENLKAVAACDFAISPTLIENLSCAILEGLMLGLPFVTFDTGGNREIVRDGVNGFIVPYLDIEALVDRAGELLEDAELLRRFKTDSRIPLTDLLDLRNIKEQYEAVFEALRGNREVQTSREPVTAPSA